MKKLILSLCTLVLLGILSVTLVGCGGTTPTPKKTSATPAPTGGSEKEKK